MTEPEELSAGGGTRLLKGAISYALDTVRDVTPQTLSRPTPCSQWNLRMLLRHVNESLGALQEAVDWGSVDPCAYTPCGQAPDDLVCEFRGRAARLLRDWNAAAEQGRVIAIGDLPLMASTVAGVGAVEIAVHGWDISRACGERRPIPPTLAMAMLHFTSLVVGECRRPMFAAPVTVSPTASPSDRLIAFLGREPA
jgi:uncharacterized protein (TIGR03086 family)